MNELNLQCKSLIIKLLFFFFFFHFVSVEFIAYFLDRIGRISKLKKQLQDFVENNAQLLDEQKASGEKYEQVTISGNVYLFTLLV